MIDEERESELKDAYKTIVKHNLWRRGRCKAHDATPQELGIALEIAAGAIPALRASW